jgi:hypothetical protein
MGKIKTLCLNRDYDGLRARDQFAERGFETPSSPTLAKEGQKGSKNPQTGLVVPSSGPTRGCATTAGSGATLTPRG